MIILFPCLVSTLYLFLLTSFHGVVLGLLERFHTRIFRGTRFDCAGNAKIIHTLIWFGSLSHCTFKSGPNCQDNITQLQQLQTSTDQEGKKHEEEEKPAHR